MQDVIIHPDPARRQIRAVGSLLLAVLFLGLAGVAVYLMVTEGEWLLLLPVGILALALVGVWIQFKPTTREHSGPLLMAGSRGVGDLEIVVPWEHVRGIDFSGSYMSAPRGYASRRLSSAVTRKLQTLDGRLQVSIHYIAPDGSPARHSIDLEAYLKPDSWTHVIEQVRAYASTRGVQVSSNIRQTR